jgi:hypothetical protein
MKRWIVMVSTLVLASCAGSRTADLDVGEHSFLIVHERAQMSASGKTMFFMGRYNTETRVASDYEWDVPKLEKDGSRWHLIRVSPGDYVILGMGVARGAMWAVCYGNATYSYHIGENQALYVGEIDPEPSFEDLSRQTVLEAKSEVPAGTWVFVHENIRAPDVKRAVENAEALTSAQTALLKRFPSTPFKVQWAEPQSATFTSGSKNPLKMVSCGG